MAIFHDWCNKNELRNYPLEDLASKKDEKGVQLPDNFLVDANLWIPASVGNRVAVSSAAITTGLVTITFVADGGGTPVPVAAISVVRPVTRYRKYRVDAFYPGVGGWIAFGGAIDELNDLSLVFADFDAGILVPKVIRSYDDLPLLSIGKKDRAQALTGLVELRAGADIEVLACTEPWPIGSDPDFLDNPRLQREIDGEPRDCIAIRLTGEPQDYENLLNFTGPCEKSPESLECGRRLIQRLSGVAPDCDGNITVEFRNIPQGDIIDAANRVVGISLDYPLGLTDVCDPDKGLTLAQREDLCDFSSASALLSSLSSISGVLSSVSVSSESGDCPVITGAHIETFDDDLSCWSIPFGTWFIDDCQLVGSSSSGWGIAGLFGSSTLGHEIQSFIKIGITGPEQRAYFIFGVESSSKFWFVEINAGLGRVLIGRRNGPLVVEESLPLWGPLPTGVYIHLRVAISLGGEITTFINGVPGPQITAVPGTLEDGVVGFATRQSDARFDNLAIDWPTTNPALFPPFNCSGSVVLSSALASDISLSSDIVISSSSQSAVSLSSESFSSFSSIFLSSSSISQISSSTLDLGLELFGYTSGGGFLHTVVDKFPFATDGSAAGVGDLTIERFEVAGQSSNTHGYTSGGTTTGGFAVNVVDKFLFATDSNATDVGDLTLLRRRVAGQSSGVSGYTSGGHPFASRRVIDKFSFAVDGNAADVGELSDADHSLAAGQNSNTHGYISGALSPSSINKFSFAADADAISIGNISVARGAVAGQSSALSGYTAGGFTTTSVNVIDKFPFAVDAGATDVGDLSTARHGCAGQSSPDNGYVSGGLPSSGWESIDKFSFTIDGGSLGVGDLTIGRYYAAGQQGLTAPAAQSSLAASVPSLGFTSGGVSGFAVRLSVIDKFAFAIDGDATDVGDLSVARERTVGQSSTEHGYTSGGLAVTISDVIDRFLFASTGNAVDVGNLTELVAKAAGQSSNAHGYVSGGTRTGLDNVIEKFLFTTSSSGVAIGDLTIERNSTAGQSSSTHGYTSGGIEAFNVDIIDKFSFSVDGNATDVGDLTASRNNMTGNSSDISGYNAGGGFQNNTNIIDKFSFAADGNATDVGDMATIRNSATGQSSADNGYVSGGNDTSLNLNIDKFSFATDGNSTSVGTLTVLRNRPAGQQGLSVPAPGTGGPTFGYTTGGIFQPGGLIQSAIDRFSFAVDGNAVGVGNLTAARSGIIGQSSNLHGYSSGGFSGGSPDNIIDRFLFATTSDASDVGDLTVARQGGASQSSDTHGYVSGGGQPLTNVIDKFTFATNANATDVGDLTVARGSRAGQSSATSGYTSGGFDDIIGADDVIDKFSFAVDGNATDVGDLTVSRWSISGNSSTVSGYTSGGFGGADVIDKFSFAVDGNATDVGDLAAERSGAVGQSSTESGYVSGGTEGGGQVGIDKFSFSIDGNSTSVGNLSVTRATPAGQQG